MSVRVKLFFVILFVLPFVLHCNAPTDQSKNAEEKDTKKEEKKEERVPVEVTAVTHGLIEDIVSASTNLEAEARVEVFARTSNQAVALLVEEGDIVAKDDILLKVENDTHQIQLAKADARFAKAEKEYNRKKDLHDKELITLQEYNDASYELKQAELEVSEAKQQLAYTLVRAPIAGTITQRLIKLGDQVNTNQHLFDIIDFDSIVARVYLPEKNLARLKIGQKARIFSQALGPNAFPGLVDKIAPTVDSQTGTVKVTVKVLEIGALRPGMYVDVNLVLDTHPEALLIPKRALVYDNDQTFVFRLQAENKVERLLLVPALMDKSHVEPSSDIQLGDQIVIAGQTGLKDGAKVRILGQPEATETEQKEKEDTVAAEVSEQ